MPYFVLIEGEEMNTTGGTLFEHHILLEVTCVPHSLVEGMQSIQATLRISLSDDDRKHNSSRSKE